MVAHPNKMHNPGEGKETMPGLYDIAGSAHWRNKADAGIVVYRDYEERCTYVVSRKIRRQPVCATTGQVRFWFMGAHRQFEPQKGSYPTLGEKQDPVTANSNRRAA